uniref:Galectin n=1 Tax=Musca domestica TaxID=7370 RepID=A0A1I8M4B1_MUSDO
MPTVFQGKLSENLKFGHILEISGQAEENGYWFSISLAADRFTESDDEVFIGLRMSIYLQEDLIVFKQRHHGEWKNLASENFLNRLFYQRFHINMTFDEKKIYISVNNRKLLHLPHSAMAKDLNTLQITGELKTLRQIDHRKYFPIIWPPISYVESRLEFSHDIPSSFQPGHVMAVTLNLSGNRNGRFHLHFCNIHNSKRQEIHISVRFDTRKIVRTSKLPVQYVDEEVDLEQLEYGIEEIHGDFPFDRFPAITKFAFGFTPTSLLLAKDGRFLFDYHFRTLNVLPQLSGLKVLSLYGMKVHVKDIEHFKMSEAQCGGFEVYSR